MATKDNTTTPTAAALLTKVDTLRKKAAKRSPVELNAPLPDGRPIPKQLPIWPESVRGVPNSILRSALFGAIKRGKRAYLLDVQIASVDGVSVSQTGPRLDQADLDVWEQCMHLARTGGLGTRIQFSAHGFLKAIERNGSGASMEWLKKTFLRLASTVVEIKDGKRAYFGPLIHHGTRDDETGHYVIEINPAIAALYDKDGWTAEEWAQRMALKKMPLAQWLHGFYSTHRHPYPYKVETLHRLCGSEAAQLFHFRAELREALEKLARVTCWSCDLDGDDLVQIERRPVVGCVARPRIDE